MMTLEQAKRLEYRDIIHSDIQKNADGSCQRWRVNGRPQTWKTRPDEIRVPIKYGMYVYGQLTNNDLPNFHLESECPCS